MDFARSARSTLGIEWELALVDPDSRELVPRADELIARLDDPRFDQEFLQNTIELISGVHSATDAGIAELRELLGAALAEAERMGVALIGAGTHPSSRWREQPLSDAERYRRVVDVAGDWGRRLVIFGVHNHVGVEHRDKAVPLMRAALDHLPLILALSASSPFWQGQDTGFASHRSMLFQQLPTGGLPPELTDWHDAEDTIERMVAAGVIREPTELRWDVRPAAHLGTVEVRIADGAPSLDDLAAVTALTHCLLEEASRSVDEGSEREHLPMWLVRENKWRAVRYGLDAEIFVDGAGTTATARAAIAAAVDRLGSVAADLGASGSLAAVERVLNSGGSAARQRAAFDRGGYDAVTDLLVHELRR